MHQEGQDSIANKTFQSLAAILQSYQSLRIDEAALEFKITIFSKSRVQKLKTQANKGKKRLPKNIIDSDEENDLIGSPPPAKTAKMETPPSGKKTRNDCLIPLAAGFPSQSRAFKDNCLIVSLAIGVLYHEAQEEKDPQKRNMMERAVTNINSEDKKNRDSYRNAAGKKILKRCKDLLDGLEDVSMQGPHPYKIIRQIVKNHKIRVLVYRDNKIKYAFPTEYDGTRKPIALLETNSSYLEGEPRKHVTFMKNPKKFFSKKIYTCPICLQLTSAQRNHGNICELKFCKHCRKLSLKKNHYYNHSMRKDYCLRVVQNVSVEWLECKNCKKNVPKTCMPDHTKVCKRIHECQNCGIVLVTSSPKSLKSKIDKHVCHSKLCKICFVRLSPRDYKTRSCRLKDSGWQTIWNAVGYYDVEAIFQEGLTSFDPVMIVCEWENVLFGYYSRISFAHPALTPPEIGKIQNHVAEYNYLGELPNRIPPCKLKPRYGTRKACWPKGTNPSMWENHFSFDHPGIREEAEKFSEESMKLYRENLKKYHYLKHLQNNPIFHFLCWTTSKIMCNRTFVAHNGAR